MEPPIELERYAALCAELDAGTPRDELCAREGISAAEWTALQEAWLAALADEISRKRFVLTNRYNNAFVARRRALTHGGRVVKRARPATAIAAPPREEVAPVAPAVVHAPSYAIAAPVVSAPPLDPIAPPVVARAPEPTYAEPALVRPAHAEPADPAPPAIVAPPAKFAARAATVAIPAMTEPVGAALPFTSDDAGSITVTGTSPLAAQRAALPFQPGPPPAPPPPHRSDPPPRLVDQPAVGPRAGVDGDPPRAAKGPLVGDSTVAGVMSPFAAGAALPFQGSRGAPAAPAPAPRPPAATPPEPATLDGASTIFGAISPFAAGASPLPFQASTTAPAPRTAEPRPGSALPFQVKPAPTGAPKPAGPTPPPAPAPRLTLEQFASLSAEIAVNPRAAAQIRARYGFDEASHAVEAEQHNRRFTADKALYDRYLELFQSYRDYVARAQR